ncbi:MAG: DUF4124 domain-containing protein [Pseudomonas sp.]|uniref:DUF4124 domain-containing protein n=1 Tax=Pseudomonas abieticivorans TaxID=2931382 RepID=UPI0020C185FC|nr:DUF4124 domain-containing protein [Pseudomonas sp. PIA16]MDE1164462.1 DUF4124 domain-containing protein [Pseudomonas sp.]
MRSIFAAAGLWVMLLAPAMGAQIYKWVDAQGQTHFDAQPPTGQATTTVDTGKPPAAPRPSVAKPANPLEGQARQREIDAQVKQQVADQEDRMQRYCDGIRTNMAQLQNNPRVRENIEGAVRRLTEEERQAKITDMQQKITENCQ